MKVVNSFWQGKGGGGGRLQLRLFHLTSPVSSSGRAEGRGVYHL